MITGLASPISPHPGELDALDETRGSGKGRRSCDVVVTTKYKQAQQTHTNIHQHSPVSKTTTERKAEIVCGGKDNRMDE